jgi:hypothetical protein
MLQSQECDVIHIQTPSQTCSNKLVANNLVNVPEKQCPMMFIVLLGFAIMAPLAPNLAFILEYSQAQVLGTVRAQYLVYMWALGTAVGSALGLNVGALLGVWLFSRLNTWSTSDPPPILVDHQQTASRKRHSNKRFGPKTPSQNKYCIISILG